MILDAAGVPTIAHKGEGGEPVGSQGFARWERQMVSSILGKKRQKAKNPSRRDNLHRDYLTVAQTSIFLNRMLDTGSIKRAPPVDPEPTQ